jgi:MraZ protein
MADGVELLRSKIRSGRLDRRTESVQLVGRLLSTRHRTTPIAGRGRIAIPDAFREFLGVEPGGAVMVVGAAVCVEIWRPASWNQHIGDHMPGFRQLFDQLTE